MPTTKRPAKPKPKPKRTVQRSLFDKAEPKISPKWKQPKHDKAADPTWFYTWQPPQAENVAMRRKVFGW
jgi:hypothetical protein